MPRFTPITEHVIPELEHMFQSTPRLAKRQVRRELVGRADDDLFGNDDSMPPTATPGPLVRPKVASIADKVIDKLAAEQDRLDELAKDLTNHSAVYGAADAAEIMPERVRQRVEEILAGSKAQTRAGILGAGAGTLAGAGLGTLTGYLSQGRQGMLPGAILSGLGGGLTGHSWLSNRVRKGELRNLLTKSKSGG